MADCPICGQKFKASQGVTYLNETYCSDECARQAAEEGRNLNEPEPEEAKQ